MFSILGEKGSFHTAILCALPGDGLTWRGLSLRIYRAEECRDRFNLLAHAPGFSFTFTIPRLIHVAIFLQKILSFCERLDVGAEIRCVVSRRASHYHADDFAESVGVEIRAFKKLVKIILPVVDVENPLHELRLNPLFIDEIIDGIAELAGNYNSLISGKQRDCATEFDYVGDKCVVGCVAFCDIRNRVCSFHVGFGLLV